MSLPDFYLLVCLMCDFFPFTSDTMYVLLLALKDDNTTASF